MDIRYKCKTGVKDDVKIFGLNDWKDEVVINQDGVGKAILADRSSTEGFIKPPCGEESEESIPRLHSPVSNLLLILTTGRTQPEAK